METMLSFALWAVLIWLLNRLGQDGTLINQWYGHLQDSSASSDGGGFRLHGAPPERSVDPACGNPVTPDKAKPSIHAGNVYYFCSRECREVFEAAPDLYLGTAGANQRNLHTPVSETVKSMAKSSTGPRDR